MAVSSDPVCWINIESMLSQRCVPALGCHSFGVSPVPVLNYPDLDLQSMRGSRKFCQSVVRIWSRNQNEFINASSNGSDEPAQKHGLARAFSVRTHSFYARMNQT